MVGIAKASRLCGLQESAQLFGLHMSQISIVLGDLAAKATIKSNHEVMQAVLFFHESHMVHKPPRHKV